jgi:hypothetical protein
MVFLDTFEFSGADMMIAGLMTSVDADLGRKNPTYRKPSAVTSTLGGLSKL